MIRTSVNVIDDTVAAALVAKTEGEALKEEYVIGPSTSGTGASVNR